VKGLRNPFRLRRSESIDTDDAFLTLFEPGILEVMPQETLWDSVHIIRSAAGGGKTSLIRLFTPTSLNALCRRGKSDPKIKELLIRMIDCGAVGDNGPRILGVLLTCGPGYALLQDLDVEQTRKTFFFFGLLNARITLAVLRGALTLKGLPYPEGLDQITVASSKGMPSLQPIKFPCSGRELYDWAEQREAALCGSLDSLGPLRADKLRGDDALYALNLVEPSNLTIGGAPVSERVLLMMDDIHKLTSLQRELLVSNVIDARSSVGVWIAERFEALSAQEMLSSGAEKGRDYGETIEIEKYWRSNRWDKFEKLTARVADRRINEAEDTEIASFQGCIEETLSGSAWDQRFADIAQTVASRVKVKHGSKERFQEWVRVREEASDDSPQKVALEWRKLEILIERDLNKRQKRLFDEQPLSEEEFGERDDSSLTNAAELFLAREFDLPYYYGSSRLARLASLNIQQFLGLSGDVFEESAAAEVLRRSAALPPERQHAIVKAMAKQLWDDIPKKVRHGRELRQFLESVGKFSHDYTYRPTAPNDPGVTGTAIRMSERAQLFDEAAKSVNANAMMLRLAETIASGLSHNLLVAQLDYKCKNEKWMLLNLNRLLCAHFDLPLGYGQYKERPLKTLIKWMDYPYENDDSQGKLL
jgi:hypothetical protein